MIIEKVTGRNFYDEANRRLLRPLKLSNTIAQDGPKLKGVVQGYAGPKNPFGRSDAMIVNGKFVINSQFECKAPLSYLEAKLHIDSVLSFANNDRYIVGHRFFPAT